MARAPTSLLMSLGADVWVRLMFGEQYASAAAPLRLLAPMFLLTYVNTLTAVALILLDRGWTVTRISLAGMAINLVLNVVLAPAGGALWGPKGAALGCAAAMVLTEALTTGLMLQTIRGRAFDRRSATALVKSLAACAVAIAVDRLARGLGPARLLVDVATYLVVVIGTGALPLHDFLQFSRAALRHRHDDL